MFTNKNERKYIDILRRLAKSDSSIFNQLKVTVCEGEFNEEKQCFLIAPLMSFDSGKDLENKKQTKKTNEDSTEHSEISNENKNEISDDYPDSSDFSDDE